MPQDKRRRLMRAASKWKKATGSFDLQDLAGAASIEKPTKNDYFQKPANIAFPGLHHDQATWNSHVKDLLTEDGVWYFSKEVQINITMGCYEGHYVGYAVVPCDLLADSPTPNVFAFDTSPMVGVSRESLPIIAAAYNATTSNILVPYQKSSTGVDQGGLDCGFHQLVIMSLVQDVIGKAPGRDAPWTVEQWRIYLSQATAGVTSAMVKRLRVDIAAAIASA